MEVRCPNCNVRYDLDADLVKSGPVRLQCSACDTIFRLQVKQRDNTWLVRRQGDGEVLELDGLPELQRWIVERRVTREDEISRSGKQWKSLGSITELASFFAVIDQLERVSSSDLEIPKPSVETSESESAHSKETRAAPSPKATTEATVKADAKVLADLSASIEEALDSGELGVRADQDEEKLTAALLESLGIESSGVRRPISGVQDPQKLRKLLNEQSSSVDGPDDWESEPIQLEATAIEVPQHKITEVGGTEALPVARPNPHVVDADDDHELEQQETVARRQVATEAPAPESEPAVPMGTPIDNEPTTVRPVGKKAEVPDIGPTGADWFVNKKASQKPQVSEDESLETHIDREITQVGRRPSATVWVAVAVIAVVLALAVVLITQSGGEGQEEPARAESSSSDDGEAETGEIESRETPNGGDDETASGDNGGSATAMNAGRADMGSVDDGGVGADATAESPTESPDAAGEGGEAPSDTVEANSDDAGEGTNKPTYATLFRSAERDRERGRYIEAIRTYERALGIKKTAEARAGVGWAYLAQGKSARAVQEFRAALDYSTSYQQAYTGLAKSYESQGNLEKALETWELYLSRYPSGSQSSIAKAQKERLSEKLQPEPPPGKEQTPTEKTDPEKEDTGTSKGDESDQDGSKQGDGSTPDDKTMKDGDGKKIIIIKKPK